MDKHFLQEALTQKFKQVLGPVYLRFGLSYYVKKFAINISLSLHMFQKESSCLETNK